MNNFPSLLMFAIFSTILFLSSQNHTDNEADSIKKVIAEETDSNATCILKSGLNLFSKDNYLKKRFKQNTAKNANSLSKISQTDFQELYNFKSNEKWFQINRSDWDIQVRGNTAWAKFRQVVKENECEISTAREVRILEKQDGKWHIALMALIDE